MERGAPVFRDEIESVAVSPDGSQIAFSVRKQRVPPQGGSTEPYHRLMVLGTMTGKVLHQSDITDDRLGQLTFSPDGKLLAAGGEWAVHIWKVGTEKPAWHFGGHLGAIQSLAFSPDSKRLASASADSTVLVWDLGEK